MPRQANQAKSSLSATTRRKASAYHHGDLRQALKDAALDVLAGPDAHLLSFRELTRRLGVTTGAPYHHFKDRTALLVHLATEGFTLLHRRLEEAFAAAQKGDALVQALTIAYLEFARKQRGYYQAMFLPEVCAVQEDADLRSAAENGFQLVCHAILQVQKEFTPGQASERAVALWSLLHGILTLRSAGTLGRRLSLEQENRFAVDAVRRLLQVDC